MKPDVSAQPSTEPFVIQYRHNGKTAYSLVEATAESDARRLAILPSGAEITDIWPDELNPLCSNCERVASEHSGGDFMTCPR